MATIYKISSYRTWQSTGTTLLAGAGGGTVDMSAYYTKIELQTAGSSEVSFDNITDIDFIDSIERDSSGDVLLVGDEDTPGNNKYYGTDGSGTKGWHDAAGFTDYDFVDSIEEDSAGEVRLVNDEDTPGNSMVYGTNAAGTKGWYEIPDIGGTGIYGTGADNQIAVFNSTTGIEGTDDLTYDGATLYFNGALSVGTDFVLTSDERLKQNIVSVPPNFIDIEYKQFELKSQPGIVHYGVIAQDLIEKYPELIRIDKKGMLSVAYIDLLIREIVYLKDRVREFEKLLEYE